MKSAIDLLFGTEPTQWIQSLFGLGCPLPFRMFSLLGGTWGISCVLSFAFWLFGRRPFYALVGIVVVGPVIKVLISEMIHHARPESSQVVMRIWRSVPSPVAMSLKPLPLGRQIIGQSSKRV